MNAGLNKAQCDLHHVDGEGPSLRAIVPTPFPLPWSPVHVRLCLPLPMGELHIAPVFHPVHLRPACPERCWVI